ncbi:hypothetical protein ZIOFF_010449 [Zingiber officinale]|uniref:phosphoglycerate mutase (2,3-diphosphoglycerate-dependent) n=1 Tax=Zingiber officinale TaxID=94328 RepID=A0A8J5HJ78_ZINOF|nr:hypothetical protein ZIOFF_010449 [Zingiber officinale]
MVLRVAPLLVEHPGAPLLVDGEDFGGEVHREGFAGEEFAGEKLDGVRGGVGWRRREMRSLERGSGGFRKIGSSMKMASAATCLHATSSIQAQGSKHVFPLQMVSKGFSLDMQLRAKRKNFPASLKLHAVHASSSHSSIADPIEVPSNNNSGDSEKKSTEASLILIRHGESLWNEKNLFTGCVDVPLTKKGVEEAIQAGKRISNIPIDMIYTSSLIRAQMTAMLAISEHRRKKVPIIIHNENEQAQKWSQIYSEETKKQSIPVITAWQLNERMYGELQGLNKQETAELFGKEKVHEWRRSYDVPPPNGESLEMCAERAVAYFREQIVPQLLAGKNVMIAAHGNSLRSIIMYLDKLTSQEVIDLELSTGIPMLYIFKNGMFVRRGSPIPPSEAGVYAYTRLGDTNLLPLNAEAGSLQAEARQARRNAAATQHLDEFSLKLRKLHHNCIFQCLD